MAFSGPLRSAANRIAVAVGFTAGIASFLYGLSDQARQPWAWILVGVAAVAAASAPIVSFAATVVNRYNAHERTVQRLGEAESAASVLESQVTTLREALPRLWERGIREGWSRTVGAVGSMNFGLKPRHFDIQGGAVLVSADLLDTEPGRATLVEELNEKARFALVHLDTDKPIAILAVESVTDKIVTLRATQFVRLDSWDGLINQAVVGSAVPPGLGLRSSSLDDYKMLEDSTDLEAPGGDDV
ncbi:hypothetical protein [Aeromicrobium sp. Leaf350]|uniref:hypothetical protein n=1 Tax=Aeromicrobium sp. Leaf350 TaxID=2876565 RepID=UPI001E5413BD|nr:hypothetical protein [Aeromicrobium sp. Leaf350]